MPAPRVIVDHDVLEATSDILAGQANEVQAAIRDIKSSYDNLRGGGWIGLGASLFFQEMEEIIFPVLQRLASALAQAARLTDQISQIFLDAEEEAGKVAGRGPQTAGPGADGRGPGVDGSGVNGAGPAGADGAGQAGPSGGGGSGVGARGMGPLDYIVSINKNARGPRQARNLLRLIIEGIKDYNKRNMKNVPIPRWMNFIANNPVLRTIGRGLSIFDTSFKFGQFLADPSVESGADTAASAIGTWGSIVGGPKRLAFSFGYWIGKTFIAPHTTEPLSNLLTKWDPFDLQNSARNMPRTTIKDYERAGQPMPRSVAKDVYVGLMNEYGADEAGRFARDYSQKNNISVDDFRSSLGWPMSIMPIR